MYTSNTAHLYPIVNFNVVVYIWYLWSAVVAPPLELAVPLQELRVPEA